MLRKLGFTARIFIATTLLVVLALGAAGVVTYVRGYEIASSEADASLQHSLEVQHNVQTLRFQRLRLMSRLIASDPAFVSYALETAGASNDPFATGGGQNNAGSLKDLLGERQTEVEFDLGLVLDGSGQPVAQVGGAPYATNLASDPVVAASIKNQNTQTGYWLQDGAVYQVAVAPLANRDQLAGYLVLALAVDHGQLQQMAGVSGSELAVFDRKDGKYLPIAGTLDAGLAKDLDAMLQGMPSLPNTQFELSLGGGRWVAVAQPLDASGTSGVAITLTSLDRAMGGYKLILATLVLAALLVTLLAALISWWLSGRLARPLRELAKAAQAAAHGDYQGNLRVQTGGGEIAQVTQAVDSLLSDLREKDEIEKYMTDLAKYQSEDALDQPLVQSGGTVKRPQDSVFLALRAPQAGATEGLDTLLRGLEAPVRRHGGKLASTTDQSVILVFEALDAAYMAAGDILTAATQRGQPTSAALLSGKQLQASLDWTGGQGTVVMGVPVKRLEELLADAPAGVLVTDADTATRAKMLFEAKSRELSASGRSFVALELPDVTRTPSQTMKLRATQGEIAPGAVLGGRYEVLARQGAGGMGVIYKVRDRELNEVVVLKTIHPQIMQDPEAIESMKSEIKLSRKITHRNVVRIYDFGDVGGLPFISMEYVRGMTLKYMLQKRERIPYAAGLRLMRQVCTALQVAHEQGVLHRDVKPDNVMLEPTGNAKLMDFGIASMLQRGTAGDGVIAGTPPFAAPEQLRGAAADERADIYACGVMMYQMFTGKLPFEERQLDRLLAKKDKQDYRPPASLATDMPPALETLIVACLSAEPSARPADASALLARLEAIRV